MWLACVTCEIAVSSFARPRRRLVVASLVATGCQVIAGLDAPLDDARSADAATDGGSTDALSPSTDGAASAYAAEVLNDTPTAYFRFSETSGDEPVDATGRATVARITGAAARGRPSVVAEPGASLGLVGGARVQLPSPLDRPPSADATWEVWIRPTSPAPEGPAVTTITSLGGTQLQGSMLFLSQRTPSAGFERWTGDLAAAAHASSRIAAAPGGVYHLVGVSRGGVPRLVVNGGLYQGFDKGLGKPWTSTALVELGTLEGDYDEVAFYDYALSDERIQAHYAAGRPR